MGAGVLREAGYHPPVAAGLCRAMMVMGQCQSSCGHCLTSSSCHYEPPFSDTVTEAW